jgi:hypothetical protein
MANLSRLGHNLGLPIVFPWTDCTDFMNIKAAVARLAKVVVRKYPHRQVHQIEVLVFGSDVLKVLHSDYHSNLYPA